MRLVLSLAILTACGGSDVRTYTLEELPVLEWTSGIPVHGAGKLVVSKSLVGPRDWSTVKGRATFTCTGCTLGDDHTKVLPDLVPGGVQVPPIALDRVDARADFADGRMHLSSAWKSGDLELDAEINGVLAQRADDTELDGCIRLRALDTRDPNLRSVIEAMIGGPAPDGSHVVTLGGTLGAMTIKPEVCDIERYRSSDR